MMEGNKKMKWYNTINSFDRMNLTLRFGSKNNNLRKLNKKKFWNWKKYNIVKYRNKSVNFLINFKKFIKLKNALEKVQNTFTYKVLTIYKYIMKI